jgi:hypothetical protein
MRGAMPQLTSYVFMACYVIKPYNLHPNFCQPHCGLKYMKGRTRREFFLELVIPPYFLYKDQWRHDFTR